MFIFFVIKSLLERYFALCGRISAFFVRHSYPSGALTLCQTAQSSSRQVQIGQGTQYKQGMSIFGQATITYLGETKDAFHDTKHMLDLCPHFRLGPVARPVRRRQRFVTAAFCLGKVPGPWRSPLNHFTLSGIGRGHPRHAFHRHATGLEGTASHGHWRRWPPPNG